MLAFPRYFDMFEMKRPQFMGRFLDDDDEDAFMNNQSMPQNKQPKRIQVPVQHEPTMLQQQYQRQHPAHQMPQPSAFPYGQQPKKSVPVSNEMQQPNHSVRNLTQIPVQHVSPTNKAAPVSPPCYSETERVVPLQVVQQSPKEAVIFDVPIEANSPTIKEGNVSQKNEQKSNLHKRPAVRKQTSLIVSDDHTTPIPMPYESLDGDDVIEEEEEDVPDAYIKPKVNPPSIRKQTSLIVSDDHTTPIPMPYSPLETEIREEQEECSESSKDVENSNGSLNDSSIADTEPNAAAIDRSSLADEMVKHQERVAPAPRKAIPIKVAVTSPTSETTDDTQSEKARNIPISVQQGTARPTQGQEGMNYSTQSHTAPRAEPTISKQPVQAGMPMPQPQPTGSVPTGQATQPSSSYTDPQDTYTQPKPSAPKPKEKWVDPRITAALDSIQKIGDEAKTIGSRVDELEVTSKDKKYLTIEEQLTKLLLKLDSIDSFGDDNVRSKRKACIRQVQQTLDALELKVIAS